MYRHVLDAPGLHLSELLRRFPLAPSTVRYHLDQLERMGLLTRMEEGGYVRYYARLGGGTGPKDALSRDDKRLVALLRQRAPAAIVHHLLEAGEASQGELATAARMSPSALAYHLKKLLEADLVAARREGKETRYSLTDPARVAALVYRLEPASPDLADAFADAFDDLRLD